MIKSGITRRIDELGRIVIPKEIRKNLKIRDSDEMEISIHDGKIILNKYEEKDLDIVIPLFIKNLGKFLNKNVLFTSKERVLVSYNKDKRDLQNNEISDDVKDIIDHRQIIKKHDSEICLFNEIEKLSYIISPIIIHGDLYGSIILYDNSFEKRDEEYLSFSKMFLENYLE